jgi:SnoaL-like protein
MGRGEEHIATLRRIDGLFHEATFQRVRESLVGDPDDMDVTVRPLVELFARVLDPSVEIDLDRAANKWPGGTEYHGLEGWFDFWIQWLEPWNEFEYTRPWSRAIGDAVVSEIRLDARGEASGLPVHWHFFQLWRFRNGRIVYLGIFDDMQTSIAAATE